MDYALHYLAAHKHTRLITIDVGANDAFLCQETTADHCSAPPEVAGVASEIAGNLGTMFVGFSADRRILAAMLGSMAGVTDGARDALTRYTRPLTGAYYFIPSIESLRRVAAA